MKRKALLTMLYLATSVSIVACGKGNTTEQQEVIATEQTAETEKVEEQAERETETEMFGIEDITTDESNNESTETTIRTDYPDTRSDHRASWDTYKDYYDDFSVYGNDTAGKGKNDLPYCGPTGYDPDGTILQKRTTDKGYTVWYDTNTGKTYYSSMMLPTGSIWTDITSDGIVMTYARSKGYNNIYDVTYAEMQEVLGVYNGD